MIYENRVKSIVVAPKGEPLFSELSTEVFIEDESAGEFVVVRQTAAEGYGKIAINSEEWPALRKAIDTMIEGCKK